ncbi:TRAP transporter small permease [Candidatus Njordibacter sp. Uisw_056]|jgi:TRAP-type C4-dicarboxylate transport system permease small subunit|uniref:TRAP transporter small permease n=1 Tax=Candidatus Njordibacter sp. Uisw_056 TaxID=3230973 RepID=UPI003D58FFD7
MKAISAIVEVTLEGLDTINTRALLFGRTIGLVALGLMVLVILAQIFFRYVLNNALPWPEEAARGLMIWMMALVAPSAYRYTGFVSIDMLHDLIPAHLKNYLVLAILLLCSFVSVIMLQHAWSHFSAPLLFDSSGLNRLLQDTGINQLLGTKIQFRTAYIYLAMSVLLMLILMVSLELILRQLARIIWGNERFPIPKIPTEMAANS